MPRMYDVQLGTTRYSPEFQTAERYQLAWQRALARAYRAQLPGNCLCNPTGERPIYIRQIGDRYVLGKYPDTGPLHASDCHYYSPPAEGLDHEQNHRRPGSDELHLRLPVGLRIRTGSGSDAPHMTSARRRSRVEVRQTTLSELLHVLWDRAGLNEWRPEWKGKRSLFSMRKRLRDAAATIATNGVYVFEHLLVGAARGDEQGEHENVRLVDDAQQCWHRLLVVARMAAPNPDEPPIERLRVVNFHGVPRIYVSSDASAAVQRHFAAEIEWWKAGSPTIALAQIEPVPDRSYWRAVDLALMGVTHDYVCLRDWADRMPLRSMPGQEAV